MAIVIGLATEAERDWAARLMASSEPWITLRRSLEKCAEYLAAAPDAELFIARERDEPSGFLFLRPRGLASSPYIASIAVAPAHRARGVGTAMLGFAETRYVPPARHIFPCVSAFNDDARRLYERVGYREVGSVPDYIVEGTAELILHKRLAR
jgi:[ribosomal protein S18]-alanine N-acetyltransferase